MHVIIELIDTFQNMYSAKKLLFKSPFFQVFIFYCDGIQSTTTSKRATVVTRYTHYVVWPADNE